MVFNLLAGKILPYDFMNDKKKSLITTFIWKYTQP
jgi:hypothetical protein